VHDETDSFLGAILARMDYPEFPVPMGVLHRKERPTYDGMVNEQLNAARASGNADLQSLLLGKETWTVK
jgi:2-oxoglutarate ferredoxin oxidoreductase subunit beta